MDYKNLSVETWKELDTSGSIVSGYKSVWLSKNDNEVSCLHIFKDELNQCHFAIEDLKVNKNDIEDPGINGLSISLNQYRIGEQGISRFIDIKCSIPGYLEEFIEVTKEITKNILYENEDPSEAINKVIRNWRKFWANQSKLTLSEDQQIGLICELKILDKLCQLNSHKAINSWVGPLGEKHDFNFTDWSFEVKGTRRSGHTHTINGIDQLRQADEKSLGFVSFLVSISDSDRSLSLQDVIESTKTISLNSRPDLVIRFNELLAGTGYSPIHAEEYRKVKIEILESILFTVDNSFPRLTSDKLIEPLDIRITDIRYNISLEGLNGINLNELNWGNYFY